MSARHIGYYIHHHGAGHLTRAVQIMRHSRSRVTGLSSLPRPQGWVGPWIELPRDDVPEAPGDLAPWPDADAGGVLHWAPLGPGGYRDRMGIVADWLSCHRPDLLVVDVSAEVTLLARLLGVRVAVAAMRGDRTDRAHEASYDVAHLLLAPWPARPRRASEPGWPARWMTKTVHTGGISRFDDRIVRPGSPEPERPARRVGDPLVSVLWGRGGGAWTPAQQLDAQEATPGWRWETAGQDGDVWSSMSAAEVVISHAGQNAVAEVAAARRPAVVIALPRPHAEQVATARALAAADLAQTCVGLPAAREWPGLLEGARHRDGRAWTRWTDGFGGYRAARAIDAAAAGRSLAARTAVITLARGRHDHLRGLLRGLAAGTHVPERLIVVALGDPEITEVCKQVLDISDGAIAVECIDLTVDGEQLPLARARNLGAAAAADLGCRTLIFLDVDCIPSSTLVDTYASYAGGTGPASPVAGPGPGPGPEPGPTVWAGTVAYLPPSGPEGYDPATLDGLADPHPARPAPLPGQRVRAGDLRLFWSLSFAMTTADFAALGGFDEAYVGYGGEDTDFAMRLRAAGGSLWWLGGAAAYHQHHPTQNPPVQHRSDIVRNANLFAQRWGWHPMEGWLAGFADAGLARLDPASGCWMLTEPEEA